MQEIQPGVYWLPLQKMVNVYLIQAFDGLTLVDCGYGRQSGRIMRAASSLELKCGPLKHILITHGHNDHIGGAAAIQAETGAEIWTLGPTPTSSSTPSLCTTSLTSSQR